jgi:hypothetical protein
MPASEPKADEFVKYVHFSEDTISATWLTDGQSLHLWHGIHACCTLQSSKGRIGVLPVAAKAFIGLISMRI